SGQRSACGCGHCRVRAAFQARADDASLFQPWRIRSATATNASAMASARASCASATKRSCSERLESRKTVRSWVMGHLVSGSPNNDYKLLDLQSLRKETD